MNRLARAGAENGAGPEPVVETALCGVGLVLHVLLDGLDCVLMR